MELIHADHSLSELGYIIDIDSYDAEISQETDADIEKNTFSLVLADQVWEERPILTGHYVYAPGTEFGGMVEKVRHSTAQKQVTVSGVTWRGMMFRKVIEPPEDEAYLVVQSEANAAISLLVGNTLGHAFTVSAADSGVNVNRQFRYARLMTGVHQMLSDSGGALQIIYNQAIKKVVLSARPIIDYSNTVDLSQDYGVDMVTTSGGYDRFNHIIALGAGELLDRDILHVYRNPDGTTTTTPPAWAGTEDDHVATYDYTNPENLAELQKGAEKRLLELAPLNQVEIDPRVEGLDLLLGDVVGARDRLTGMVGTAVVVGKILTMNSNGIKVETRVI